MASSGPNKYVAGSLFASMRSACVFLSPMDPTPSERSETSLYRPASLAAVAPANSVSSLRSHGNGQPHARVTRIGICRECRDAFFDARYGLPLHCFDLRTGFVAFVQRMASASGGWLGRRPPSPHRLPRSGRSQYGWYSRSDRSRRGDPDGLFAPRNERGGCLLTDRARVL
jgi:hypothetical protein